MTVVTPQSTQDAQNAPQNNAKEINFRQQEQALKAHYERQLEQERRARLEAERAAEEARRRPVVEDDDEVDPEPYVDHKKLNKKLAKFGEQSKQQTQTEIQKAIQQAQSEARREAWLETNQDFEEVLSHAEKLAAKSPTLANTILKMPDNFERQKLVYQTIKEMGLHKPEEKKSTIQDTIEKNKRGQYYQPSGIAPAPYAGQTADFSQTGQAEAYKKMKSLISNVRLS
jgi:hypothetical protein